MKKTFMVAALTATVALSGSVPVAGMPAGHGPVKAGGSVAVPLAPVAAIQTQGLYQADMSIGSSELLKSSAVARGLSGAVRRAASAPLTVPYFAGFDSADEKNAFTIIDSDADGLVWDFDEERQCMKSGGTRSGLVEKDDWLITPGIRLETGKVYTVSLDMWRRSTSYAERAEIRLGTSPAAEGMTTVLLERTDLQETSPKGYEMTVTVPQTGTYYLGVHAVSDPLRWTIYVDNIKIECSSSETAPAAVADFSAVPDINGEKSVEVSFTAPSTTFGGGALASLTKIEVSRDGYVTKTFDRPAPGASLSYTDSPVGFGPHVYTVVAYGAAGQSQPSSTEVFVGFDRPKAPARAYITEDPAVPGKVIVTWDAVTEDINGKIYPVGTVKYIVADQTSYVARDVSGTSFETQAVLEGQDFAYYGVFAVASPYGQSDGYANTGMIPVGEPYAIPFYESAPGADLSYHWGMKNWSEGAQWGVLDLESSGGSIDAFDGDNGYMGALLQKSGDRTMLMSGKIDIAPARNPYVRFAYWAWEENPKPETITLKACNAGDVGNMTDVAIFQTTAEAGKGGWQRVFVPLDAFKGKTIQVAFEVEMGNHFYTMFDAITVYNVHDHDMGVTGITTPARVKVGEEHTVTAEVENRGVSRESDYTVDLIVNGKVVESLAGTPLSLGEYAQFTFTTQLGVNNPAQSEYKVRVNLAGDGNSADNESETRVVFLTLPNYPTVPGTQGTASADGSTVTLSWEVPDTSNPRPEVTADGFEEYESFAIDNVGDWTLLDLDYEDNYVIEDNDFPHNGEAIGFIVLDTRRMQTPYDANSGHKAMASFASTSNDNNDWLITPELWSGEQEVSFFAKSHIGLYGLESFDVLYSTDGTSPYDFTRIGGDSEVPTVWTRYSYTVPAGTKYVAVRCNSKNMLCFMVDDFEFMAASSPLPDLTLRGYNVYRDMERLNAEPLDALTYTDSNPVTRTHIYHVTAVYNAGESQLSDAINPYNVGVVAGDAAAVSVKGLRGLIMIQGASGQTVSVYSVTGALTASAPGQETMAVTAAPGVYVVTVGDTVSKVLVR